MESLPLVIGVVAAGLFVFWIVKKLLKLALWAAIIGAAAWFWYFKA
jgi:hypothetical protein